MEQLAKYLVHFHKDGKVLEQEFCDTEEQVRVLQALARKKNYETEVSYMKTETKIGSPASFFTKKIDLEKETWEKRVVCIETGKVFPSVRECSRCHGIIYKSLYNAIKSGHSRNGLHFAFVDTDHVEPKKISPKRRKRKPISNKTFVCVTNNETFHSAEECFKKYGIPPTSFYRALKTGKPINGLMFVVKKETAYFHKQAAST